jgi:YVTN family beta-propeller protein
MMRKNKAQYARFVSSLSQGTGVVVSPGRLLLRLGLIAVILLFNVPLSLFSSTSVAHASSVATIPVDPHPLGVAVDSENDVVYVATNGVNTHGGNTVDFFNGSMPSPFPVNALFYPAGRGPSEVAVNASPGTSPVPSIYVTNNSNNSVSVVNNPPLGYSQQFTISVGRQPAGVAVNTMTNLVYVANFQDSTVSVIQGTTGTQNCPSSCLTVVATVGVGHLPIGVAANPITNRIYVTGNFDNTVSIIDGAKNTRVSSIPVGLRPVGIAVDPLTNRIYVANSRDNTVSVIDGANNAVIATIRVGHAPNGVAVNPKSDNVFVTNANDGTVSVIDGATNTVTSTIGVGRSPLGVAVNPKTHRVFVTNFLDNTVSTFADPADQDLITVPVRICAVQGSPATVDPSHEGTFFGPEGSATTDQYLLKLLQQADDEAWLPGAHILFRAQQYPFRTGHFPIIPDPRPPGTGLNSGHGKLGDIDVHETFGGVDSAEREEAVASCRAMWEQPAVASGVTPLPGIIVVNARLFVEDVNGFETGVVGLTPAVNLSLQRSFQGSRADNLCSYPRHLTVNDVLPEASVVDVDPFFFRGGSGTAFAGANPAETLAHELGHALMLGHGNGLDPDRDGTFPPNAGPRNFDTYCDPEGGDPPPPGFTGCGSIMNLGAGNCTTITPLQREAARDVAVLEPGARFHHGISCCNGFVPQPFPPPCLLKVNCLSSAAMTQDVDTQLATFTHTVFGILPSTANNRYAFFADVDGNPATGCAPSTLGFPTAFQGAELVTSVSVKVVNGVQQVAAAVWQCQAARFVQVTDPQIQAHVFTYTDIETGDPRFSQVVIQVPNPLIPSTSPTVRVQVLAQQLGAGGRIDRLPNVPDGGVTISLAPPTVAYPECSLTPSTVQTNASATVDASGLTPNSKAEVELGTQRVATGTVDAAGTVHITFTVPRASKAGLRLVTVVVQGTVQSAGCGLQVEKAPPVVPPPFNVFLLILFVLLVILVLLGIVGMTVYRRRRQTKTSIDRA